MTDWIYSRNGKATIILDKDRFRNNRGQVIAWLRNEHVYSLTKQHVDWFESGVIYDSSNSAIGFFKKQHRAFT